MYQFPSIYQNIDQSAFYSNLENFEFNMFGRGPVTEMKEEDESMDYLRDR